MSARVFSAHLARGADADRALLVDDRWRWGAFAFPLLWALWGRHWLLALALIAALGAVAGLATAGFASAATAAALAIRLILGWEGASAIRLDRRLRGWRDLGGVSATSAEAAELAWFARQGRA